MIYTFSAENFSSICDELAARDGSLGAIIQRHGYPPMWGRPNTFESLVHILLEQQVSLASALAALNKLREKLGEVTPEAVLQLTDEELKSCYFSRQKTTYVRILAEALHYRRLSLEAMEQLSDDTVREQLCALKGIGNWTVDIYLIFVLRRRDIFPAGDLAAVNALKQVKAISTPASKEELQALTAPWQPYRTIATMILWHYYLSLRTKKPAPALSGNG